MATKVMIVDDIFNTRALLKQLFIENGFIVTGDFEDGIDAYKSFKEERPDLVILDYNLNCTKDGKNYTGIDLMKDIKSIRNDVKIVFISANAESSIIKNAILQGASDFICKPFNFVEVIERINKVLNKN